MHGVGVIKLRQVMEQMVEAFSGVGLHFFGQCELAVGVWCVVLVVKALRKNKHTCVV